MLKSGSDFVATIEKPVAGGRMLARHDGQVVLVSGTIPGERVRARITQVARGVAYAAPIEILEPHASRREPLDAETWRRGPCGGNVYRHISYDHQLVLKQSVIVDAFTRIARVEAAALEDAPPIVASPERGYRMRARLHLHRGRIGFFREGSHELCDPAPTGQLSDTAVNVIASVEDVLRQAAAGGLEGEVELAENVPASERVLHFGLNRKLTLRELKAMTGVDGLTGFTTSVVGVHGAGVVIAEPHVHDDVAIDAAPPVRLRRHVRSFFQGNRFLLNRLVGEVVARVPVGPVVDLYAGVGLFSVPLALAGRRPAVAVEVDAFSAHDLRTNAMGLDLFEIVESSVEAHLQQGPRDADATVVVDPPRTGVSKEALSALIALRPRRVVYVSCDVATLARDTRAFLGAGYRLRDVLGFDLFPNTAHIETVLTLTAGVDERLE